eukprot:COSAG01_NODE_77730_length_158_cov_210.847458_1_plen_46_part_10
MDRFQDGSGVLAQGGAVAAPPSPAAAGKTRWLSQAQCFCVIEASWI